MTKELKQFEKWLDSNGIQYDLWNFGGDYFGPRYVWQGIHVCFDFFETNHDPDLKAKKAAFEKYIKRSHKNITVKNVYGGSYDSYRVFYTPDYEELEKYESAKNAAVNKYWEEVHAAHVAEAEKADKAA